MEKKPYVNAPIMQHQPIASQPMMPVQTMPAPVMPQQQMAAPMMPSQQMAMPMPQTSGCSSCMPQYGMGMPQYEMGMGMPMAGGYGYDSNCCYPMPMYDPCCAPPPMDPCCMPMLPYSHYGFPY